jgi:hypothetical protein
MASQHGKWFNEADDLSLNHTFRRFDFHNDK